MSIDTNEIEKYIFDPNNPKQCKSYNLLLNIAKKDNLVYISSDFVNIFYESIIINESFNDKLWDKPENYEELNVNAPICASCKKIRDDKGYWNQIEAYIHEHSDATFSHGICPECAKKLYPEYCKEKNAAS